MNAFGRSDYFWAGEIYNSQPTRTRNGDHEYGYNRSRSREVRVMFTYYEYGGTQNKIGMLIVAVNGLRILQSKSQCTANQANKKSVLRSDFAVASRQLYPWARIRKWKSKKRWVIGKEPNSVDTVKNHCKIRSKSETLTASLQLIESCVSTFLLLN